MDLLEKVPNVIKGNELRALETLYRNEISKLGKIAPMLNCEKIGVEDIDIGHFEERLSSGLLGNFLLLFSTRENWFDFTATFNRFVWRSTRCN